MKKVEIKNYQHEKGQFMAANGAEFTVKEIIPHSDISTFARELCGSGPRTLCLWIPLARNERRSLLCDFRHRRC